MRFLLAIAMTLQLTTTLFAQDSSKLILLYMQMRHCPWCHKMNEEVFENPQIMKRLQSMYKIEKKYRGADNLPEFVQPRYYPTTYIISTEGKLLDELPGYMDSKRFIEYLEELYELENAGL